MKYQALLLVVAIFSSCDEPGDPKWITLSGKVLHSSGKPWPGVVVNTITRGGFWSGGEQKEYRAVTDTKGNYGLNIEDGHFGKTQTITATFDDETSVSVELQLSSFTIRMPVLQQWAAKPQLILKPSDSTATTLTLDWTPLPESYGVSLGTEVTVRKSYERWNLITSAYVEPLFARPDSSRSLATWDTWEGENGITYPLRVIEGFSREDSKRYEVAGEKTVLGKTAYTLRWIGGRLDFRGELAAFDNNLECYAKEEHNETADRTELLTNNSAFLFYLFRVEWVACEFPAPTTIGHVAWYGAYQEDDYTGVPNVNVYVVGGDTLPEQGFWGPPVATEKSSFGLVEFVPTVVARWIILAPAGAAKSFYTIAEVRAW